MSTPPAGSTIPEPTPPKCPHCKADMPTVVLYPYQIGQLLVASVQCASCHVLLHMGIIPIQKLEQMMQDPSRIHKPS